LGTTPLTSVINLAGGLATGATFSYADSSGNTQQATLSMKTYTFQTNFGCTVGIFDGQPQTMQFPSRLTMPDGRVYNISYETTPGYPASITGRIASISLPTGGSISYTYTGGNNNTGVYCDQSGGMLNDGMTPTVPILTRTINDANGNQSVWVYNFSDTTNPYLQSTVTVTDPANNTTVYHFSAGYQEEEQVYQGAVSPSNLLKTTITCYNGNFTNCPAANNSAIYDVTQTDVYTSYNGGPSSLIETLYNAAGMPSEAKQYDNGATMPPSGAPLVDTVTSYGSWSGSGCSSIPGYIYDRPCEVTIKSPPSAQSPTGIVSDTRNTYDNAGNLLTVAQFVSGSTYVTKTYTYGSNGALQSSKDGNGNLTTYTNGACNNLLPTQIFSGGLSITEAWDCNGAVLTSSTGPNQGQTTTYAYNDPLYRLTRTQYPDGGETSLCYTDVGGSGCQMSSTANTTYTTTLAAPSPSLVSSVTSDGLNRPITSVAPSGAISNTIYLQTGYVYSVSNAHLSTPSSSDGVTTYGYDALGRMTVQNDPGGTGTLTWTYSGNSVVFKDEDLNQWTRTSDGLGRLKNVIEPTGALTSYSYDAFNNPLTINQNGVSGDIPRAARSFVYDGLSRLTSSSNPETGNTVYFYDANNNLTSKMDGRGITTTYSYDPLTRNTSRSSNASGGITSCFSYDGANIANGIGLIANEWTQTGSNGCSQGPSSASLVTRHSIFSYDLMGRVTNDQRCTIASCAQGRAHTQQYQYDLAGNRLSFTDGLGKTTFGLAYDAAGRLGQLSSTWSDPPHPPLLLSVQSYSPVGIANWSLGNALSLAQTYDSRTRVFSLSVQRSAQ
jgi:YD repeat-containing protein